MEASITVADMMAALSALPPDARLVVTESGYYSYGELARVGLPEAYTMDGDEDDIPVAPWCTVLVTATKVIDQGE
jgi:hypothetical protein